ncbi:MAG: hypothetical protein JXQ76_09460 [Campylobacterales bacterium]|nr:hypothetical protein [Campylobacterales bacterium]
MKRQPVINPVSIKLYRGYHLGKQQPYLNLTLEITPSLVQSTSRLSTLYDFFQVNLNHYKSKKNRVGNSIKELERVLVDTIQTLLLEVKMPLFDKVNLINLITSTKNTLQYQLHVPLLSVSQSILLATKNGIMMILNLLNMTLLNIDLNSKKNEFERLIKQLKAVAPQGHNTSLLLQVAHHLNIPWRHITKNIYQFGWGKNLKFFDSSISADTAHIGTVVSDDKMATHEFLRDAGIPSLQKFQLSSEEQALKIASQIGYPVVIKPRALNRGEGVMANIHTPEILKKAYKKAHDLSKNILIEKHFYGKDYRLHVCQGEIYYATQREAAKIKGDGRKSVQKLVDELNFQRKKDSVLKEVKIDEEMLDFIQEQNHTLQSILPKDELVYLGRIANVSTGGTTTEITDLSIIHSDNITLAKRVAKLLRLDICAIDFLSPDITQSWLEVGGVVCEVNAKPQIGSNKALEYLLRSFVPKNGRIPTIGLIGKDYQFMLDILVEAFMQRNQRVGVSSKNGIEIDRQIINKDYTHLYDGSVALVSDSTVDVIILVIEELSQIDEGLAIDGFDYFIVLSEMDIRKYRPMAQKIFTFPKNETYFNHLALNNIVFASQEKIVEHIIQGL